MLLAGVNILDGVMRAAGFVFEFRDEGRGSGGPFAWGEYVRDNRRLELHFRGSLGLVRYHVADHSASHEAYMRGLGAWEQCQYPGFSEEPLDGFVDLAADLAHATDFLRADAMVLRRVAAEESTATAAKTQEFMAGWVGDAAALEHMRSLFRAQHYRQVVEIFAQLKYPQRISSSERKMVEIARRKVERSGR
jgi:hypothetical protein